VTGALDTSFGDGGFAHAGYLGSFDSDVDVEIQTDGKIVLAGFDTGPYYRNCLARFLGSTPPLGACCAPDGSCTVEFHAGCPHTWLEGQVCDPNPCEQSAVDDASIGSDLKTALLDARPNPFRGRTDILFRLGSEANAEVAIFDAGGRLVRTLLSRSMPQGTHQVTWNGDLDGGGRAGAAVYLCRFRAGGIDQSLKIFRY
jgi:hypothetical protein